MSASRMRWPWRLGLALALLLAAQSTWAFELAQLQRQLAAAPMVRGAFTQEKSLGALPQPLVSTGRFVLARDHGLLWQLRTPVDKSYRIDDRGVAQRTAQGWQATHDAAGATRQNRLLLAMLGGDLKALAEDFELELRGDAQAWELVLTPRSRLLAQIFARIQLNGGATVEQVLLEEAQGDRTRLRFSEIDVAERLSDAERAAFAD